MTCPAWQSLVEVNQPSSWGEGLNRLIVGFQPLMVISSTASCIRWCIRGDLM